MTRLRTKVQGAAQLACVFVLATWVGTVVGQTTASPDVESVRKKVTSSTEQLEAFPAVKLNGRFNSWGPTSSKSYRLSLQVRGKLLWIERIPILAEDEEKKRQAIRKVMQCELPDIIAFDGKNCFTFSPFSLGLEIRASSDAKGVIGNEILPRKWIDNDGSGNIREAIAKTNHRHSVELLDTGVYKWKSETIIEMFRPNANILFPEKEYQFDPKFDYLPTSFECNNRTKKDVVSGKIEWAKSESRWYPKHTLHYRQGKLTEEVWIDEITFDAKACRVRFDDMESLVPFATRIMVYDANRKLLKTSYKGGAEGETEWQLRNIARQKIGR